MPAAVSNGITSAGQVRCSYVLGNTLQLDQPTMACRKYTLDPRRRLTAQPRPVHEHGECCAAYLAGGIAPDGRNQVGSVTPLARHHSILHLWAKTHGVQQPQMSKTAFKTLLADKATGSLLHTKSFPALQCAVRKAAAVHKALHNQAADLQDCCKDTCISLQLSPHRWTAAQHHSVGALDASIKQHLQGATWKQPSNADAHTPWNHQSATKSPFTRGRM